MHVVALEFDAGVFAVLNDFDKFGFEHVGCRPLLKRSDKQRYTALFKKSSVLRHVEHLSR